MGFSVAKVMWTGKLASGFFSEKSNFEDPARDGAVLAISIFSAVSSGADAGAGVDKIY